MCRQVNPFPANESYPSLANDGTVPVPRLSIPATTQASVNGGCFGSGPGLLDVNLGRLAIDVNGFVFEDQIYEILLNVSKVMGTTNVSRDMRTTIVTQQIRVVADAPPIADSGIG
jgi:hypothetical protein